MSIFHKNEIDRINVHVSGVPLPVFYIYILLEYIINQDFAIRKWTKMINQGATSLLFDDPLPSAFSL